MTLSDQDIRSLMNDSRYPLSNKYDPDWILQNMMGAHTLWLQEALLRDMTLQPGQRVLDLGCGKAISSIFLAQEYGLQVCAADLWIDPTDNWARIREADVEQSVFPVSADAQALPFAKGYFDGLLSLNSLFFYVTDGDFLREKILSCVKPGGEIGVIVPGFHKAYTEGVPEELKPYWSEQLDGWHTLDWWVDCFGASNAADILVADTLPDNEGTEIYARSAMLVNAHEEPFNALARDNITFIRIIARRKEG